VRCVDWLRGLAVLVMIECHALVLLLPGHDNDAARHWFNSINGLAAPTFIFCAGFALALGFGRVRQDRDARRARTIRSLRRIGIVLIISILLKHLFWQPFSHPVRFLWLNVLDCILLSMLAMIPVLLLLRWRGTVLVILSLLTFVAAPLVASPRDFGWLNPILNNRLYVDTWPLVPWAGYAFCGGAIGILLASRPSVRTILLGWIVLGVVAFAATEIAPLLHSLFAESYDPYLLTNIGQRLLRIAIAGLALLGIEQLVRSYPRIGRNPALWLIDLFGRQSLVAYVTHLLLLFCPNLIPSMPSIWHSADWGLFAMQTIGLIILTASVCYLFDQRSGRTMPIPAATIGPLEPEPLPDTSP
jgi:uncharacterized membrane protein